MKTRQKLILGISSSLIAMSLVIYIAGKTKKNILFERLDRIADEGYETAGDILFPAKTSWTKKYRFDNYGRKGKFSL